MPDRWQEIWRKVTLRRHRSELRALGFARKLGFFAIYPIIFNLAFWWFALLLPALLLMIPGSLMMASERAGVRLIGGLIEMVIYLFSLIAVCVAAPWLFRWYFIAVGLMFGRTAMADRKEAELVTAIDSAEAAAPST